MKNSTSSESRALPVAAHTPGPWRDITNDDNGNVQIEGPGRYPIVICTTIRNERDDIANARLIAAAPELLAALESAVLSLEWARSFISNSTSKEASERLVETFPGLSEARAALAKAKGQA